jgi:hypothetical protein
MVNLLKPFEIILEGVTYAFKGIRWAIARPEAQFAVLLLPGLGYAKAAFVLAQMIKAESLYTEGELKFSWVLNQIRLAEKSGTLDLGGISDKQLYKLIEQLVPIAEGQGHLVIGEAK